MINNAWLVYIVIGKSIDNPSIVEDRSIGLFDWGVSDDDKHLCLIYADNDIAMDSSRTKLTYALGFLDKNNGIGDIVESGNFKYGGGIIQNSQLSININNTMSLRDRLSAQGIRLIGKDVFVIEYTEVDGALTVAEPLFCGRVDSINWTDTLLSISASPDIDKRRRASLKFGNYPVTFGLHYYGVNIRTNSNHLIWGDINVVDSEDFVHEQERYFKVTTDHILTEADLKKLSMRYKTGNLIQNPNDREVDMGNFFAKADKEEDAVKVVGYSKQIGGIFILTLRQRFKSNNNISIIDIYDYEAPYVSDAWPNMVGETIIGKSEVAPYKDVCSGSRFELEDGQDKFFFINSKKIVQPISNYGSVYNVDRPFPIVNTINNEPHVVTSLPRFITPTQGTHAYVLRRGLTSEEFFLPKITSVNSYYYRMCNNVRELSGDVTAEEAGRTNYNKLLRKWSIDGDFDKFSYINDGIYFRNWTTINILDQDLIANKTEWKDGNINTFSRVGYGLIRPGSGYSSVQSVYAIIVDILDIDKSIEFDHAYLSGKIILRAREPLNIYNTIRVWTVGVRLRDGNIVREIARYYPRINSYEGYLFNHIKSSENSFPEPDLEPAYLWFPFTDNPFLSNKFTDNLGFGEHSLIGYENAATPVRSILNTTKQILLTFDSGSTHISNTGEGTLNLDIYEIGMVYKKEVDISEKILMKTNGRLWNDNSDRKFEYIDSPVDILLYVKKLSNYSHENKNLVEVQWGKKYSDVELIDYQSFYSENMNGQRELKIARQMFTEEDSCTDSISESLCQDFYMLSRKTIGNDPTEWLEYASFLCKEQAINILDHSDKNTMPVFNMSNVLSFDRVVEPSASDIFLEPYIKYDYVEGIGFTKSLAITGIATNSVWAKELTPGFNGNYETEGKRIWGQCHDLLIKYQTFVEMPSNMVEQKWINTDETAIWKLRKMLEWQEKSRIQITVSYHSGRKLHCGSHIYLSLPHILNGKRLHCVCESVRKSKRSSKVTISLIIIDSINGNFKFSIVDESGSRSINIDESGRNSINIDEGVI